ncbi:MAG: hypothetical protein AB8G86_10760 [Saprospiraceae bacterium]
MKMLKLGIALLLFLLLQTSSLSAQEGQRYTEEEVNIQKLFIEANREKLLRKYENAAYLFEEVTKKDRNNPAPYYELAKVYDILDESEKALKNIKTAIKLDEDNSWYKIFLAQLHEKNDLDIEAAKVYQQLAQKEPENDYYYYQWAYFLVKSGQAEKAIIVFDNLEGITGVNSDIAERKHKIYHQMGKRKAAAKELAKLAAAFPDNLVYKHNLARYFEQIESRKNAKVIYEEILRMNPEDARASIALASYNAGNQQNDLGYLETLGQLVKKENVLIDVKIAKLVPYVSAVANEKDPATKQAILDLGKLLTETHSTAAKAYSIYGDMLYQVNDLEAALAQYKMTLKEDDTVYPVWKNAMEIHYLLGKYKDLVDFSEEAMDLFPNQGASYYYYGLASNQQSDYGEALNAYNLALMMSGKDPYLATDIYAAMSNTYSQQKKLDKAKSAVLDGLKINPKSPVLLEQHGDVLFQNGEEEAAIKQWKKALEINKKSASLERKIANRSL